MTKLSTKNQHTLSHPQWGALLLSFLLGLLVVSLGCSSEQQAAEEILPPVEVTAENTDKAQTNTENSVTNDETTQITDKKTEAKVAVRAATVVREQVVTKPPTVDQVRKMLRSGSAGDQENGAAGSEAESAKAGVKLSPLESAIAEHPATMKKHLVQLATDSEVGEAAVAYINDGESQHAVGKRYENSDGVRRDLKQAFLWFGRSAEQGFPLGVKRFEHYLAMQAAIEQKAAALEKHQAGAIDPFDPLGQELTRAHVQMEFLRQTKVRYSGRSSGFGPWASANDAGNYAARMQIARDMDRLAVAIDELQKRYDQKVRRTAFRLTPEQEEFAKAMGFLAGSSK